MIAGAGIHGYIHFRGRAKDTEGLQANSARTPPAVGFLPTSTPGGQADADPAQPQPPFALESCSPVLFRLGFGFFAGFCIAFALRTFLKLSLLAIGLALLVVLGLQFAGLIDMDWAAAQKHYDALIRWLGSQTATLRRFLTGYLPSSASAALARIFHAI